MVRPDSRQRGSRKRSVLPLSRHRRTAERAAAFSCTPFVLLPPGIPGPGSLVLSQSESFSLRGSVPRMTAVLSAYRISAPSARRQSMVARMSSDASTFPTVLLLSASPAQRIILCAMLFDGGAVIVPSALEGLIVAIIVLPLFRLRAFRSPWRPSAAGILCPHCAYGRSRSCPSQWW